jgi:hypothetical protein
MALSLGVSASFLGPGGTVSVARAASSPPVTALHLITCASSPAPVSENASPPAIAGTAFTPWSAGQITATIETALLDLVRPGSPASDLGADLTAAGAHRGGGGSPKPADPPAPSAAMGFASIPYTGLLLMLELAALLMAFTSLLGLLSRRFGSPTPSLGIELNRLLERPG